MDCRHAEWRNVHGKACCSPFFGCAHPLRVHHKRPRSKLHTRASGARGNNRRASIHRRDGGWAADFDSSKLSSCGRPGVHADGDWCRFRHESAGRRRRPEFGGRMEWEHTCHNLCELNSVDRGNSGFGYPDRRDCSGYSGATDIDIATIRSGECCPGT